MLQHFHPLQTLPPQFLPNIPLSSLFFPFSGPQPQPIHKQYMRRQYTYNDIHIYNNQPNTQQYAYVVHAFEGGYDVVDCCMGCRYRFVVLELEDGNERIFGDGGSGGSGGGCMVSIRNNVMMIVRNQQMYVHSFESHENNLHLLPFPIQLTTFPTTSIRLPTTSISFLNLSQTSTHIILYCCTKSNKPTINIQVYQLNIMDNLNLLLKYDRHVCICEQYGDIVGVQWNQWACDGDVCVGVLWRIQQQDDDDAGVRWTAIKIDCKWDASSNIKCQKNGRYDLTISTIQADPILINDYDFFNLQKRHSSIRSSWENPFNQLIQHHQQLIQSHYQPQLHQITQSLPLSPCHPYQHILIPTLDYLILSIPNSPYLLVISKQTKLSNNKHGYNYTRLIMHDQPIIQIVPYLTSRYGGIGNQVRDGENWVCVVDGRGKVYVFDIDNQYLGLTDSYRLQICDISHLDYDRSDNVHINIDSVGKISIAINTTIYSLYPKIFPQSKYPAAKYPNSPYLSIQPQSFSSFQLPAPTNQHMNHKQCIIPSQINPFISISNQQLHINVQNQIFNNVFILFKRYFHFGYCQLLRKLELQSIVGYVCQGLQTMADLCIGTVWDFQPNQYYWNLAQLWNTSKRRTPKLDLLYTTLKLFQQSNTSFTCLQILFSQSKFIKWLHTKNNQNIYQIKCTTPYQYCKLLDGCPCVYQRLLRYFCMKSNVNYGGWSSYEKVEKRRGRIGKIVAILGQAQAQRGDARNKVQQLLDLRQKQLMAVLAKKQKRMIQKIDEKWQKQLNLKRDTKIQQIPDFCIPLPTSTISTQSHPQKIHLITYRQSQSFKNSLFSSLQNKQFTTQLNLLQQSIKQKIQKFDAKKQSIKANHTTAYTDYTDYKLIQLSICQKQFQKIEQLCRNNQILYVKDSGRVVKNKDNKNSGNKDEKIRMGICVIGALYRIYEQFMHSSKKFRYPPKQNRSLANNSETQKVKGFETQKQSKSIAKILQLHSGSKPTYRRYWILLSSVMFFCFSKSYENSPQVIKTINLALEAQDQPKYIVSLTKNLQIQQFKNAINEQEYICLVESIIHTEMYRYQNTYSIENIEGQIIERLTRSRQRYSPVIWQKGISPLCQIYKSLAK